MTYAAKRNKSRCPTHPGVLLREEVIPATGHGLSPKPYPAITSLKRRKVPIC